MLKQLKGLHHEVWKDRSIIWRQTSDSFYIYLLLLGFQLWILLSSEVLQKGCPFICYGGNHLLSEVVGSPVASLWLGVRGYWQPIGLFLQGIRGYWQTSDKFLRGYWQFLHKVHICQWCCQNPLILCQMELITLQSSWQRVLDSL
jgi:hypothetical protein